MTTPPSPIHPPNRLHRKHPTAIRRHARIHNLIIINPLTARPHTILRRTKIQLLIGMQVARELVRAEAGGVGLLDAVVFADPGFWAVRAAAVGVGGYG